jgi:hypothetical protein
MMGTVTRDDRNNTQRSEKVFTYILLHVAYDSDVGYEDYMDYISI